jgi:hemoglobin
MTDSATDLHPLTRHVLSRRRMLSNTGTGVAAITFLGVGFLVTGCSDDDDSTAAGTSGPSATADPESPYTRLGGYAAITAVMENFVNEQVLPDDRINSFFVATDTDVFVKQVSDYTASVTGGTEVYSGPDMRTVHAGMAITVADFNALVDDLGAAMTEIGVPEDLQIEVVELLAPLQDEIVEA